MSKRNVKFKYYGIVLQEKNKNRWNGKGRLNILAWLDKMDKRNLLNSSIDLGDVKASVDKIEWFEGNQVWIFRFMKLREDNIPSIVKENNEAETFPLEEDEYIGEGLYMLYDNNTGIAMIQSNRFSLGLKRLEEFLTNIWEVENQRIKIKPILDKIDFNVRSRRKYKNIEISFANVVQKNDDDFPRALGTLMHPLRMFNGVAGSVKVGFGRTKGDTLNIDKISEVVTDALEDNSVTGLKLHIKDDDDSPVEVVDLFEYICKDIIAFNLPTKSTLNFSYAAAEMTRCYNQRKSHLVDLITPR